MTTFEAMKMDFTGGFFGNAAGVSNLMVHPTAAFAAGSAVGLGMMSHAFGLWAGTVAGAAEAVEKTMRAGLRAIEEADDRSFIAASTPATRNAVETLVEDARSTAREVVSVTRKAAERAAADTREAVEMPEKMARAASEAAGRSVRHADEMAKPAGMTRPKSPHDLKAIAGIGPKLEQVLNGLGIWTYDQIAAWSEAEIAWIDDYLAFKGRIARDGWIEQAGELGGKKR